MAAAKPTPTAIADKPIVARQKVSFKQITRALQAQAEGYTIVLFCSDQKGQRGTSNRAKYDSDHHMRKRGF